MWMGRNFVLRLGGIKNSEGAVYTLVPQTLNQRLPKLWNIINFSINSEWIDKKKAFQMLPNNAPLYLLR